MSREHNTALGSIYLIKNEDTDIDVCNSGEIEELLMPVQSISLDSDSDYSEISDVFEEFHKESFLRPNAVPYKKHLSKTEADWKTRESFTDDYKKTMVKVRTELQIKPSLFEEEEAIEEVLSNPPVPKKTISPDRESPILIEHEKDKDSEASSQSIVWQRLLKNSEGRFKVSPPVFDVFRQKEKHWLERPSVSWKIIDNCRVKCEKWLDEVLLVDGGF